MSKVRLTIRDMGNIDVELLSEYAPKTVENFLKLVNEKFYDGLI
ncbi:MAG: peptidylprolyl isomerase, partial [Bacillota bacterium]|nr:peptidylprolyl isomerase [Bacillota bacterium]